MPLIALRRKREGRLFQYVVVDFVFKSFCLFHGGRRGESIVKREIRTSGVLEPLKFSFVSLVRLAFVLDVILVLHN